MTGRRNNQQWHTRNGPQNTTQKTKDWASVAPQKLKIEHHEPHKN